MVDYLFKTPSKLMFRSVIKLKIKRTLAIFLTYLMMQKRNICVILIHVII
jgi:hypothetical protein